MSFLLCSDWKMGKTVGRGESLLTGSLKPPTSLFGSVSYLLSYRTFPLDSFASRPSGVQFLAARSSMTPCL